MRKHVSVDSLRKRASYKSALLRFRTFQVYGGRLDRRHACSSGIQYTYKKSESRVGTFCLPSFLFL